MLKNKKFADLIEPYDNRKEKLLKYLQTRNSQLAYEVWSIKPTKKDCPAN